MGFNSAFKGLTVQSRAVCTVRTFNSSRAVSFGAMYGREGV